MMVRILGFLIRGYQYCLSPLMAQHCRYYPSCSSYALTAIERHGALKGSYLAARRLLRCHPWAPGGYDPVPGEASSEATCRHCQTDQAKSS